MSSLTMTHPDALDALWQEVLACIPCDVNQTALATRALMRKRAIRSGEDLLRLCLAYGLGLSLRRVAAWAHTAGIATLGDTSLLDRLKLCGYWLSHLLAATVTAELAPQEAPSLARRLRLVDASVVCRPQATGTDWRVHLSLDLARQVFDAIVLTDAHGGETLQHFTFAPRDLVIADRIYGTRANLAHVTAQQADAILRITWQNLPLATREGQALDLMAALRTLAPEQEGAWEVQTVPTRHVPAIPGRLIVRRLPPAEAAEARVAAEKRARKQGHPPDPRTLEAAEYVILFTTLPEEEASTALVLALYRVRWQIEIAIKRLKSDLHLDHLRAHDPALCETYLLATLLLAVILDQLRARRLAFSPSGPDASLVPEPPYANVA